MVDFIVWLIAGAFALNGVALIVAAVIQRTDGRDSNAKKCLWNALLSLMAAIALNTLRPL